MAAYSYNLIAINKAICMAKATGVAVWERRKMGDSSASWLWHLGSLYCGQSSAKSHLQAGSCSTSHRLIPAHSN